MAAKNSPASRPSILVIAGAIMGAMQWAVAIVVTPLREEIRALIRCVDTGFAEARGEITDTRNDINELSNRVTRIETILERQCQGITAPDAP